METTKKLYKVNLMGLDSIYVVAINPGKAWEKVREAVESIKCLVPAYKELKSIELIAEDCKHPNCGTHLLL